MYTVQNLSLLQQAVIGGLSLSQTSESGTEADIETVAFPIEPANKMLAQLNPYNFPPVRKSISTMVDEFGKENPYKKGDKGLLMTILKPAQFHRK